MLIADFDYELPDELIARYPAADRRGSRLLELGDAIHDRAFGEFPSMLRPGDLLVFNNTRVIKARLAAHKETGGRAEILIERVHGERAALAHIKASKSPKPGGRLMLADDVVATVVGRDGNLYALDFSVDVMPFLELHGDVPLPPYLGRTAEASDVARYQTVYAKTPGAVAAPTAGLHFDEAMLVETRDAGVAHAWVTLHVGAGTFQSLREDNIRDNRLHSERVQVSEACCEAVQQTKRAGGRVIAIGTTSVRALECASVSGSILPFDGETDMFILPGYKFRTVDAMITNFHLPQSSLLMLVAAFAGQERILNAYRHAVREKYRFFSYGDAMFLTPDSRV
ncbi:MAG: tRNA preQ1(34) S-adenosylmethionine ribosyltransferase-isomerase QueA [Gammaproteobacteria bacterium]|nr:tRNA preQ1(34) S-adenosylmethionine ribosyltransferase-isomerase QueA [Gammaproteobacteria bacterium]MDH5240323.1 tRNA preQ1(34) S-adenosylmethionine ribosyltransferase-isomerase QueA [Gammaproteobacteria bacterium]MDH5261086.1 tRNA preQ1(34) S-adenosylmethionine ribosyltransferase-isomerase QueA [Gammaproteobacteria bacterium]MDH5583024.1 tRNA preQ1(34) S-adenosylmethionine ribosyltransferase-isomerase QueA [Gammaproteobacteria bacterium]